MRAIFVEAYPRLCERRPNLWRWIYEGTDCVDLQRAYRTNTLWGAIQRPAYKRLETLIQGMESDQVPLDHLIQNYEEGIALYKICEKRLDEAQGHQGC